MPLRGGPLGPRLRNGIFSKDRIARCCGASCFPLMATARSGHGSAMVFSARNLIARYCGASCFPLLAPARSGHGSANGLADRDLIAPCFRSLLGLVVTAGFGVRLGFPWLCLPTMWEVVSGGETLIVRIATDTRVATVGC